MYAHFKNRRFFAFFGGSVDKPTAATRSIHHDFVNLSVEQMAQVGRHCNRRDAIAILHDDRTISIVDILSREALAAASRADQLEILNGTKPYPTQFQMIVTNPSTPRRLSTIAQEIRAVWSRIGKGIYFGAVPYLDAMATLGTIDEHYGCDPAQDIVLYFLANATTFRGDDAKRLKLELKAIAKIK